MRASVGSFEEWFLAACVLIATVPKMNEVEPFIYFTVSFRALLTKIILQRKERV